MIKGRGYMIEDVVEMTSYLFGSIHGAAVPNPANFQHAGGEVAANGIQQK
jgi:hypothetical protein